MTWAAAILAGGRARRLGGRDKWALEVDGARLIDRQIALLASLVPDVVIVAGAAPGRFTGCAARVVPDLVPDAGALGGLYTALASARSDRVLVVACDMPFLTAPFLEYLMRTALDTDAIVPRTADGLHPLCAAYARSAAPVLRSALDEGTRRIQDALGALRLHVVDEETVARFDSGGRLLLNVNTPDDYRRARAGRP